MDNKLFVPQLLIHNEFKELELINELSQGWDNRWTYIKRGGTEAQLWVFTTPRTQFSWVGYDNAIMIEGSPPRGSVIISFIRTDGVCNSHHQKVEGGELIIVRYGEDVNYLASDANEIFTLGVEEQFFDQAFYRYFGKFLEEMRLDYRLAMEETYVNAFILQMQHWLSYFQKEESQKLTREMFFRIEEDIIENLFSLIRFEKKKSSKEQFNTAKARRILEENIDNIYTIGDLVDELGISARTLQHHFKEKLGITPKQYLQHLRLNAIREELLRSDPQRVNVSDIALKYGFFHPSHFSLEYKKLFGETPTRTLTPKSVFYLQNVSKQILKI